MLIQDSKIVYFHTEINLIQRDFFGKELELHMTDITTREDITLLITAFYTKVRADEQLAPHFLNIDWDHHTPIIIDFWNMILLGDQKYKGNPFAKHLRLSLKPEDFTRWLFHFKNTVDEFFSGAKAEEAKTRADSIAQIFQFKLGLGA